MAPIPVVCDSCGRLFVTSNLIGGIGNAGITIGDVWTGPCPYCGGSCHIPDGVYELAEGVTRYLGAAGLSAVELRTLQTVLTQATQDDTASDDVAAKVRDGVPNAVGLLTFLTSPTGVALAQWLTFLVVLIGIFIAHADAQLTHVDAQLTPTEIEQIISDALSHETGAPAATTPSATPPLRQAIPSRNARCPCGSGKTYKNCHGRRS